MQLPCSWGALGIMLMLQQADQSKAPPTYLRLVPCRYWRAARAVKQGADGCKAEMVTPYADNSALISNACSVVSLDWRCCAALQREVGYTACGVQQARLMRCIRLHPAWPVYDSTNTLAAAPPPFPPRNRTSAP